MQFTERDVKLLRWINGHGFVTLRQIARWNDSYYQAAQRRVRQLVDLSLPLLSVLGGRFTQERRVRQIMGFTKFGERYHVPDGWLHIDDEGDPVAIELELSAKGTERLEKILRDHTLDFDIEEVWYFVESDVVRRHLMRVAEVYDSVRIFSLSDDVIAGLPKELGFE